MTINKDGTRQILEAKTILNELEGGYSGWDSSWEADFNHHRLPGHGVRHFDRFLTTCSGISSARQKNKDNNVYIINIINNSNA